jgi:type II secretion system protein N
MGVDEKGQPKRIEEIPTPFYIDTLEIDIHLLPMIKGTAAIDFDAAVGPASKRSHVTGSVEVSKTNFEIHVEGEDVWAEGLPMKEALGLPMSGKVDFAVALSLPSVENKTGKTASDWSKAEGEATFNCNSGCVVGDGQTKLKPKLKNARTAAFAGDGIDFGKVTIDSLQAKLEIKNGKMDITRFDTKSQDGEIHVDFSATLQPNLDDSPVTGCLRFKGSEALLKKEPHTFAAIQTTGAPLGPDGLYHIRLTEKFKEIRRLGQVCGAAANTSNDDVRPNLTVHPDEPKLPHPTVTPPPTTPNPPPTTPNPPPPAQGSATGSGSGSGSAGSGDAASTGAAGSGVHPDHLDPNHPPPGPDGEQNPLPPAGSAAEQPQPQQ